MIDDSIRNLTDVRILSLPFHSDARGRNNRKTLEKLERIGAQVRVNDHIHTRMMILYRQGNLSRAEVTFGTSDFDRHRQGDPLHAEVVLGSFDFNRDSLSGVKRNSGIHTSHPDLCESAISFFKDMWDSEDSLTIEEYTKDWK